jgi:hypothetical protein
LNYFSTFKNYFKKLQMKELCEIDECKSYINYMKGGIRGRCRKHGGFPKCDQERCETHVNYMKGGIRGRCGKHGGLPSCDKEGCETSVDYKRGGIKGRCSIHGGYPQCDKEGCETPVKYKKGGIRGRCQNHGGLPSCDKEGCETPTQYKEGGMIGRCRKHGGFPQCDKEGCETPPNYKEGGIIGRCSIHGGFPQCDKEGCETPISYIDGGKKGRCSIHGGHPQCDKEECEIPAQYKKGGIRGFCFSHGGSPKCDEEGCKTPAQYKKGGIKGKCPKHGGFPKCRQCKDTMANDKYDGYCCRCFCFLFPDEPRSFLYLAKELMWREYLIEWFKNTNFNIDFELPIYNKTLGGCSLRRPDCVVDCYTHVLVLENNENRHPGYTCDSKRCCELFLDFGNRPIIFVNFNPDAYKENEIKYKSCFSYTNKRKSLILNKKEMGRRMDCMFDTILYHMENIPEREMTQEYLFYGDDFTI